MAFIRGRTLAGAIRGISYKNFGKFLAFDLVSWQGKPGMITFTAATEADLPLLSDLAHRIWHACYPGIITVAQIDYMLDRLFTPDALRQDLAAGVIWELVFLDRAPVGFLSCGFDPTNARLKLSKLYLLPERHGRGLGQQMLARVTRIASGLAAREIWLTVNKMNRRAILAYERAGFRITREFVADIGGGFVMDDYEMTRDLNANAITPPIRIPISNPDTSPDRSGN